MFEEPFLKDKRFLLKTIFNKLEARTYDSIGCAEECDRMVNLTN